MRGSPRSQGYLVWLRLEAGWVNAVWLYKRFCPHHKFWRAEAAVELQSCTLKLTKGDTRWEVFLKSYILWCKKLQDCSVCLNTSPSTWKSGARLVNGWCVGWASASCEWWPRWEGEARWFCSPGSVATRGSIQSGAAWTWLCVTSGYLP